MSKKRREIGYYLGVDVGQALEPTALAIVARDYDHDGEDYPLECSYFQELPGGTTYPAVAARLSGIEKELLRRGAYSLKILVDVTGQGQPVIDHLRRGLESELISAQFTAGAGSSSEGDTWGIRKEELITHLKIKLQTGRLTIAGRGRDPEQERAVSEILRELESFTYNPPAAEDALEVKTGPRNALITALGLAVWLEREWRVSGPIGGLDPAGIIVKGHLRRR